MRAALAAAILGLGIGVAAAAGVSKMPGPAQTQCPPQKCSAPTGFGFDHACEVNCRGLR